MLLEVGVQLTEEGVLEFEVCVEKKGQHGFVSDVDHQAIGLGFAGLLVGEVDKWSEVSHGLDATFVRKVVRSNDEAMQRFGDESEAVLWIDSAEVRAAMQSRGLLFALFSCAGLGLLTLSVGRNLLDIL